MYYTPHGVGSGGRRIIRVGFLDDIRVNSTLSTKMTKETASDTQLSLSSTVFALRAAAAHVERSLTRVLEPFGVTAAQFELLLVVERLAASGAGCSELGRHLAAPGPDVTRMLDRLDSAGLVSRSRDDRDRRVVHAMLTEKGRELIARAGPSVAEAESGVFEGLSEPDRQQLLALLTGVRRNCPDS